MDYFEADVARSQMFTCDVIKARNVHIELVSFYTAPLSIRSMEKTFLHGAAFYTLNGKNVKVMLELF